MSRSAYGQVELTRLDTFEDCAKDRTGWVFGGGPSVLSIKPGDFRPGDYLVGANHQIWIRELLGFPELDSWIFGDLWVPMNIPATDYPFASKWVSNAAACYLLGAGYSIAKEARRDAGTFSEFIFFEENDHPLVSKVPQHDRLHTFHRSSHAALHIAWLAGCNPINIAGLDFGPVDGKNYWFEGRGKIPDPDKAKKEYNAERYQKARSDTEFMIEAIKSSGVEVNNLSAKREMANAS